MDSTESHLIFGALHLAAKNYKAAIDEFTQAERMNPQLLTLHSQLGTAYLNAGDREAARKQFLAELQLNPRDFNANLCLAKILREDVRLDEADILLTKAIQLRPGNTSALYELAQLQYAEGKTAAAVASLEELVRKVPDFTPAHVLLARVYYKLNRQADAERERATIDQLNSKEQERQPKSPARAEESPPPRPQD